MKLKDEHVAIGVLAITAAVAGGMYLSKHKSLLHMADAARIRHNSRTPGMPYRSRLAHGRTDKNPGISNVGIDAGWARTRYPAGSGGHNLNPGPWSYLTARNENYTYSHAPTNRLLKPALLGTNARHRVQGAMGYTSYPWQAIYTYW
jgi:hypothetical protein